MLRFARNDELLISSLPGAERRSNPEQRRGIRIEIAEALDKEWPGPIPYTLLIAPGGKVIYRKTGAIEPLDVKRAVVEFLGRTY